MSRSASAAPLSPATVLKRANISVFFAYLTKDSRTCILANVIGDRKRPKCPRAFGVHSALGNHFADEISQFFIEPGVLCQEWPAWASRQAIAIGNDGCPKICSQVRYRAFFAGMRHILSFNNWKLTE